MINYLDHYDKVHLSKEINVTKCNNSKKCIVYHHYYFHHCFKYKNFTCNGRQDLMVLCQEGPFQGCYWMVGPKATPP